MGIKGKKNEVEQNKLIVAHFPINPNRGGSPPKERRRVIVASWRILNS